MTRKSDTADKQKDKKKKGAEHLEEKAEKDQQVRAEEEAPEEENEADEEEQEEVKEPSAEEKLAELQDRYLRLSAEYDNFRKRTLREKIDLQKSANENLLNALLPVADDFDRALVSVEEAKEIDAVKEGLYLIAGKFRGFLGQQGIKEIEAANQAFDTDLHEAITKIPAPTKKMKGKVVDVVQKGYYLNEKVLRFAKVVVGE